VFERIKDRRAARGEGGFTLIELLVVIIILGVLAAVVVFAVGGVGDKGQSSACKIDTRTLRTAEEANFANKGVYDTQANLVVNGLLSEVSVLHDVVLVPATPTDAATFNVIVKGDKPDGTSSCTVPSGGAAGGVVNGTTIL
jgi:prepilin-type N-terminal cleavage/methylation domain-containing protein